MTPNSILLMSGAITNDDMRMHTLIGQGGVCVCVCVCACVCVCMCVQYVCVDVCGHVQGYIGQMSEGRTSPS